jgi:hypothetical protein
MPGSTPVAPVVVAAPRRRSTASTFVNVLLGVAVVVAVGGVAFAAGRATAPASTGTGRFGANGQGLAGNGAFGPNASGAPGRSGFGGAFAGGGGLSIQGTVTAVAADSITIQLSSGQTLTIPTDAQTTYHTQAAASASDVTSGSTVIVQLSGGRFVSGGGATNGGQGTGNGTGGSGGTGNGTGNQGRGTGSASSITVVPSSS